MVKHGALPVESNYQWWTHSVQSGTLEHSGDQMAVEKMEKAQRPRGSYAGNQDQQPIDFSGIGQDVGNFTRVVHYSY